MGAAITLTMVLNTVAPHFMPLVKWLLVGPIKRWWGRRTAPSQVQGLCCFSNKSLVTAAFGCIAHTTRAVCTPTHLPQEKLNQVYEGPDFSIASRYPMVLVTLFVSLM